MAEHALVSRALQALTLLTSDINVRDCTFASSESYPTGCKNSWGFQLPNVI